MTLLVAKSQSAAVSNCSLSHISALLSAPMQIALVGAEKMFRLETKLGLCA